MTPGDFAGRSVRVFALREAIQEPTDDAYLTLLARFEAAEVAHKQAIREEKDPQRRRELRGETAQKQLLPEFEALVATGDGRGLMWIAQHVQGAGLPGAEARDRRTAAWKALAHDHLATPWVGDALELIKRHRAEIGRPLALGYLEHAHKEGADIEVKARAAHLLVEALENTEDEAELARKAELETLLAGAYFESQFLKDQREAALARERAVAPANVAVNAPAAPPAPIPPPDPLLIVGHYALPLDGLDLNQEARTLADVAGHVTVVVFFGFWSPPSRAALQDLQALEAELGDASFAVYAVSAGDSEAKASEWAQDLALPWPVILQGLTDAPLSDRWKVRDYPELFVLDPVGRLAGRVPRGDDGVELRRLVRHELAKLEPEFRGR